MLVSMKNTLRLVEQHIEATPAYDDIGGLCDRFIHAADFQVKRCRVIRIVKPLVKLAS